MPFEPPYEPPEIEIVVVGPSSDPDGDDDDEPEEVVAIYRRGPDGRLVEVPKPPAEAAEPPAEEAPAPPARPPPLTRMPRNGEPPMTKEQMAAFRRRRANNPNYLPSPYDPL
jgi:hypothetical protein